MSVSLVVGERRYTVGSAAFFRALFSTIFVRLEDRSWGARFPAIMQDLYGGRVPRSRLRDAETELVAIRAGLARFPPGDVVWNHEDMKAAPPWADKIAPTITSLANYFWTSDGEPLLDVIATAVADAQGRNLDVQVR